MQEDINKIEKLIKTIKTIHNVAPNIKDFSISYEEAEEIEKY